MNKSSVKNTGANKDNLLRLINTFKKEGMSRADIGLIVKSRTNPDSLTYKEQLRLNVIEGYLARNPLIKSIVDTLHQDGLLAMAANEQNFVICFVDLCS